MSALLKPGFHLVYLTVVYQNSGCNRILPCVCRQHKPDLNSKIKIKFTSGLVHIGENDLFTPIRKNKNKV